MNVECCICFEKQFINPCGAFNNCKACVCNECKVKTMYNDDDVDYYVLRCLFCKEFDFKTSINDEIEAIVNDDAINPYNYILYMLRYNYNDRYKDFYINNNDYGYCFICEED
jgi:hypothetical protein